MANILFCKALKIWENFSFKSGEDLFGEVQRFPCEEICIVIWRYLSVLLVALASCFGLPLRKFLHTPLTKSETDGYQTVAVYAGFGRIK